PPDADETSALPAPRMRSRSSLKLICRSLLIIDDKSNSLSKHSGPYWSSSECDTASPAQRLSVSDPRADAIPYRKSCHGAARSFPDAGDNPGTTPSATTASDRPPASDRFGRGTSSSRRLYS